MLLAVRERLLLVLFEKREIFPVSPFFQFFHRNKSHRSGVHAVAQACRGRSIIEDMSQMGIGVFRPNLGARHEQLEVGVGGDILLLQRFGETGPASA